MVMTIVGAVGGIAAEASDVSAVQLAEPTNGAIVRPGAALNIKLSVPPGLPVSKVTYTLLEEDRAMEDKVEDPPAITAEAAPFNVMMPVPLEAVGTMRLLAVATVQERRGHYVLFDETSIRVEPEAALLALRAEAPVRFTKSLGEVQVLSVRGDFADRTVRDLTSGHTGTAYKSGDEKVVRVNADGRAQAVGNGTAEIIARNRGKEVRIPIVVNALIGENRPPVAHAGADQTVKQGARVNLDAILSADPEGVNPYYYWSQVRGMPVDIVEPLSLRPYFTAPAVVAPKVLKFRLIVKDKDDGESFPAYVTVTVKP
jgi:hypothetical protein